MIGKDLGRYHVVKELGEGGMAGVYKGFDNRLNCDVAIKFILKGYEKNENFLKRFSREAKLVAQLTHPNIVSVIDYGSDGEIPYLVMEFIPGGTLKERMGRPIEYHLAAKMLIPIAKALSYAHKEGIIHRDIKPANILVTKSQDLMLSDFGIAKILGEGDFTKLTASGVGIGTPTYMAPEQCDGKNVDHRADIYSLGIVFYEMITGRPPYEADTPLAVMYKHVNDPLPRPKQFIPKLPDSVEKLIFKALAKDPDNRFQSMDEFVQALVNFENEDSKTSETPKWKAFIYQYIWIPILLGMIIFGVAILIYGPNILHRVQDIGTVTPYVTLPAFTQTQDAVAIKPELTKSTPTIELITLTPTPYSTKTATITPTATPKPFVIQSLEFGANYKDNCDTDATINSVRGDSLDVGGTISMRDGNWVLWCYNAKHTWLGTLKYAGYTFDSDKDDPLQFMVTPEGYKYIGGKGVVTLPDGSTVTFLGTDGSEDGAELLPQPQHDSDWQPIQFTLPSWNNWWTKTSDNSYTATGIGQDTFAWTEETYSGNLLLSFEMEIIFEKGQAVGGCILVFGNGKEWSQGTLIFCVDGEYQRIQTDTAYEGTEFLNYSQILLDENHMYTFTIEILDNSASLYLDGEKITSAMLPSRINPSGKIGLYKYWEFSEVTFYNIRFKEID